MSAAFRPRHWSRARGLLTWHGAAGDFGVNIDGQINVDMKQVKARKDAIVKQSNDGVTELAQKHGEPDGV